MILLIKDIYISPTWTHWKDLAATPIEMEPTLQYHSMWVTSFLWLWKTFQSVQKYSKSVLWKGSSNSDGIENSMETETTTWLQFSRAGKATVEYMLTSEARVILKEQHCYHSNQKLSRNVKISEEMVKN